jgi:hypothetical protein
MEAVCSPKRWNPPVSPHDVTNKKKQYRRDIKVFSVINFLYYFKRKRYVDAGGPAVLRRPQTTRWVTNVAVE